MTSALGCLAHLAGLAIVTVLVDRATAVSLPPELRPWVPLAAAALLTLGLSNVWSLARGYGQGDSSRRALLRRAHAGQPPPQDGPVLATGRVRTEGPPLVSPVTGRPCAAYQYRIYERHLVSQRRLGDAGVLLGLRLPAVPSRHALAGLAHPRDAPLSRSADPFRGRRDERARTEAYTRATPFDSAMPASRARRGSDGAWRRTVQRTAARRPQGLAAAGRPHGARRPRVEEHVLPVERWRRPGGSGQPSAAPSSRAALLSEPPESRWCRPAGRPARPRRRSAGVCLAVAVAASCCWPWRTPWCGQRGRDTSRTRGSRWPRRADTAGMN